MIAFFYRYQFFFSLFIDTHDNQNTLLGFFAPDIKINAIRPDILGNGLFEIRVKGTEGIGRSSCCTVKNQEVIILHTFIKKSQKTPNKEMGIARKRLKEVKS